MPVKLATLFAVTMLRNNPLVQFSPDGLDGNPPPTPPVEPAAQPKADPTPSAQAGATPDGRTFSQAEVDRFVQDRLQRERSKISTSLTDAGYDSIADLTAAAARIKTAEEKQLADQGEYRELLERTRTEKDAEIARLQGQAAQLATANEGMLIDGRMVRAAANSLAPDQVASLLRSRVKLMDGEVVVMNEQGAPMTDGSGNPMTIEGFVTSWLETDGRHFLPAAAGSGANSRPGTGAANSTPSGYDPAKRGDVAHLQENREEIIRKLNSGELKF